MAIQNFSRNQNPTERAIKASLNVNEPHICKECGSTFFTPRLAEQISISNYAIRGVSTAPQTYYTCLGCGDLFVSGNMQNMANKGGERESFLASVELSKIYKEKNKPTKLIKNTASISEVEDLKDKIETLESIIANIITILNEEDETEEEVITPEPVKQEVIEKINKPRSNGKKT